MSQEPIQKLDMTRTAVSFGAALLLPVLLALTVFPTPGFDTRELIAWGRQFPLVTPIHPPLMTWVGGLTDMLLGSSSAAMIFVGQALLFAGLVYFYRILRLCVLKDTAIIFTFIYGISFYFAFAPLSFALNADILQLTSWPAIVFHVLRACQTNRFRHWLLFGLWSGIAVLTKYNAAGLFIGIAGAVLLLPACRKAFFRPGLLIAIAVGAIVILPHGLAVIDHRGSLTYGLDRFDSHGRILSRIVSILELLQGYLTFSLPASLIVAIGLWKKHIAFDWADYDPLPVRRFLLLTAIISQSFIVLLMLAGGLNYIARFTPPYLMLSFLALFSSLTCTRTGVEWFQTKIVPAVLWFCLAAAIIVIVTFSLFRTNSMLQEPTAAEARAVLEYWDKTYSCGPKYFIGGRPDVSGIGIEAKRDIVPLDYTALTGAPWFDKTKMRQQGAIIIDAGSTDDETFRSRMAGYVPGFTASAGKKLTLPLRRTATGRTFTLSYWFVAPEGCRR